jgi:hypothetical protein
MRLRVQFNLAIQAPIRAWLAALMYFLTKQISNPAGAHKPGLNLP